MNQDLEYPFDECIKIVTKDGMDIKHLPAYRKNDPQIMLAAIKNNYGAMDWASDELKKDRNFILKAIEADQSGYVVSMADKILFSDRKVMAKAVMKNGGNLRYASSVLKNDTKFVNLAVHQSGFALEYASESLKDNKDIAIKALNNTNGFAYKYMSKRLKEDLSVLNLIYKGSIKVYVTLCEEGSVEIETRKRFENLKINRPDSQAFLLNQFNKAKDYYEQHFNESGSDNVVFFKENFQNAIEYILKLLDEDSLSKIKTSSKIANELITEYKIRNVALKVQNKKSNRLLKF